ncbi:tyrosine-type recombinase/integrase [Pandoraea bronchicola]|uniref:Putative phage integrase n=1 Tax=Pandoraea bronchicola TaxID=2508287 RepID=A0A5E5BY25_9BURK|nr:site-specific integrase [Pandoraea bronchicola]VVE90307.1 putative phage integrase [Pandoraea bronchicola]
MPSHYDKSKGRWRYTFNRVLHGRRFRASKLLPKGWGAREADEYGRNEDARLYSQASGLEKPRAYIAEAVRLYLEEKCPQLKNGTKAAQDLLILQPYYEGRFIDELPDVAAEYAEDPTARAEIHKGGVLSPATIRNRLAYLRAACRYAFKYHAICEHDPAERMRMPVVRNQRKFYPGRRDLLRIMRACEDTATRALLKIAFYSGMRKGEILGKAQVMGDVFVLHDTKNGESRTIPIHPRLHVYLKRLPFTMDQRTYYKYFMRARKAVGLEHIRIHDLRHGAASELINNGVDLYTVGAILGHKSQQSTARYSHLTGATLAGAINRIGQKNAHHKGRASSKNGRKAA